jgi:hypothetical protein
MPSSPLRASAAALALLVALAACAYERPSPVGTNCVQPLGRNAPPVCTN